MRRVSSPSRFCMKRKRGGHLLVSVQALAVKAIRRRENADGSVNAEKCTMGKRRVIRRDSSSNKVCRKRHLFAFFARTTDPTHRCSQGHMHHARRVEGERSEMATGVE